MTSIPDPARVKRLSELGRKVLSDSTKNMNMDRMLAKPYKWKRNLVEHAFGGVDPQGRRLGVYVSETGDKERPWTIEIRGILEKTVLGLPLDDENLEEMFKLDPEYQDINQELQKIRASMTKLSMPIPWQFFFKIFSYFLGFTLFKELL